MARFELPALYADNVAAIVTVERLLLVNRDPGPAETGVPLDWPIALEVLDTGSDGVDRSATRVFVDGVLAFDGGAAPELQPGFDGPRSEVVETADTLRVVLDPTTPFASEAEVDRQKGTAAGIENAIRFLLGIDVTAITPFTGTTLVLGESELGVDWELGPSDRFARYAFESRWTCRSPPPSADRSGPSWTTSSPPTPTSWT